LDHFDAIRIGLTATPASHTTTYFRDVVYRYEYERAVREGYLVDYDPVIIKSNVRLKGSSLMRENRSALSIQKPAMSSLIYWKPSDSSRLQRLK